MNITQPRNTAEAIGAVLRDLAEVVSDEELAERAGIPVKRLTRRLGRPSLLEVDDVERIARALHVTFLDVVRLALYGDARVLSEHGADDPA